MIIPQTAHPYGTTPRTTWLFVSAIFCIQLMPFASEKTIAREKLAQIIAEGKEEEVRCRFCNRAYRFSPGELTALL